MFEYRSSHLGSSSSNEYEGLLKLARVISREKRIISIAFAVSIALAFVAYSLVSPKYEATSLLLVGQNSIGEQRADIGTAVETSSSMVSIIQSEDVIRDAVGRVGLLTLVPANDVLKDDRSRSGIFSRPFSFLTTHPKKEITALDQAVPALRRALDVSYQPNTKLIHISFRHPDPATATAFVDAIVQSFIDRQLKLFGRSRAADFYQAQKEQFDKEVQRASEDIQSFVAANAIYSVNEERQLLLKRKSDSAAALAATRVAISDKTGQRTTLTAQLRLLKPVTQSPYVSSLVTALGGDDRTAGKQDGAAAGAAPSPDHLRISDGPPLLMVRVYQEAMLSLFKVNGELAGLTNMEKAQTDDFDRINDSLAILSSKEAEITRLKRVLQEASFNSDVFARRMVEEQTSAASDAARFSTVKIVHQAYAPPRPISPNFLIFAALGLLTGIILSVAAVLLIGRKSYSETAESSATPTLSLEPLAIPSSATELPKRRRQPKARISPRTRNAEDDASDDPNEIIAARKTA
jgi:uncharacterized protein involved in exopolysaccharide biosynthesis